MPNNDCHACGRLIQSPPPPAYHDALCHYCHADAIAADAADAIARAAAAARTFADAAALGNAVRAAAALRAERDAADVARYDADAERAWDAYARADAVRRYAVRAAYAFADVDATPPAPNGEHATPNATPPP